MCLFINICCTIVFIRLGWDGNMLIVLSRYSWRTLSMNIYIPSIQFLFQNNCSPQTCKNPKPKKSFPLIVFKKDRQPSILFKLEQESSTILWCTLPANEGLLFLSIRGTKVLYHVCWLAQYQLIKSVFFRERFIKNDKPVDWSESGETPTGIAWGEGPAGNLFATKVQRQEQRGTNDEETEAMPVESEPAIAEINFPCDSTNN